VLTCRGFVTACRAFVTTCCQRPAATEKGRLHQPASSPENDAPALLPFRYRRPGLPRLQPTQTPPALLLPGGRPQQQLADVLDRGAAVAQEVFVEGFQVEVLAFLAL